MNHGENVTALRGVFDSWTRFFVARYRKMFAIDEIESSTLLQWYFGASLLFFLLVFDVWVNSPMLSIDSSARGLSTCWPYFKDCHKLYFYSQMYVDYSRSMFYMALYGIMLLTAWNMWKKNWAGAHALLLILLAWETFVIFVLTYSVAAPYYYYHIALTATLLFVHYKEFFLKLCFVFLYFMSATIKYDDTWILGTYFTSMKTGLPIFPDALTPLFTNFVILMQTVGCWFLMSRDKIRQRLALVFFTIFHLYSGLLVFYFYVTTALLPLLIFFGPFYRHTPIPFSKKAGIGWFIIALLLVFQILGFVVPGDRRWTLENNRMGMFMFEANHQCIITTETYSSPHPGARPTNWEAEPGTQCADYYCTTKIQTRIENNVLITTRRRESGWAFNRCDPYEIWLVTNRMCDTNPSIQKVALTFDHSINGKPFFRIVDTENICDLDYKFLRHNEWIQIPPDAPLIGYPVTNTYRD